MIFGRYRRHRTHREEMMHDQIQKAMNWDPDFPRKDKNGVYHDKEGNELICISLKEFLEKIEKDNA